MPSKFLLGGGFGRSRGRGVREFDRNGRDNDRNGRDNRNGGYKGDHRGRNEDHGHHNEGHYNEGGYYNGPRNGQRILEDKPEDNGQYETVPQLDDEFDINPPEKSTNWADDEYEEEIVKSPKSPPVAKPSFTEVRQPYEKSFTAPEPVLDLRDKLKAMRLEKGDQPQGGGNQHFAKRNYQAPQYDQNFAPRPVAGLSDQYFSQRVVSPDGNRTQQRSSSGNSGGKSVAGNLPRPKRNTENFEPSFAPPEMRILCARPGLKHYDRPYSTRDVLVVNDLFGDPDDLVSFV